VTRINCVPPSELTGPHLVSEYRELPRCLTMIERRSTMKPRLRAPQVDSYRMGTGHVLFFADKAEWLRRRHGQLVIEMQRRGYAVNMTVAHRCWLVPAEWQKDWKPSPEALRINRERLQERLK
jgi:deoxyribonuclease (pyrimidine dimer)